MEDWEYFVGEASGLARVNSVSDQKFCRETESWVEVAMPWSPDEYRASKFFTPISREEAVRLFPKAFPLEVT